LAIEFRWQQSGNSNLDLGTSASLTAGAIQQGDLLIACVVPQTPGGTLSPGSVVAPPGWIQLDNSSIQLDGVPGNAAIFYKIANGSEGNAFTFSWANSADYSWTLLDYSGVDPSSPIDAFGDQTNDGGHYNTDTMAPSVNATAGDTLVNIWISKGGAEQYAADPSTHVRVNTDSNTFELPEIMVADKHLSASGPTGADVMTEFWSTINQRGFSIALNAAACFMSGTLIRTPTGEHPVETLKRGDPVCTTDDRVESISWVGRQTISLLFADPLRALPIRIRAGALSENVPSRDLLISPDHAILVNETLVQAGALINGSSITRETRVPITFTYFHVELEDHSLILAENTPAETFIDNVDRLAFDNWQEHEANYPAGKPIVEMPYPRAKAHRQVPTAIRELLASRACTFPAQPKNSDAA
jgi:Hint domain